MENVTRIVLVGDLLTAVPGTEAPYDFDDDKCVMAAMILNQVFDETTKQKVHIAAPVLDTGNLPLFSMHGIPQAIPLGRFAETTLAQMVFHRGRSSGMFIRAMSLFTNHPRLVRRSVKLLQADVAGKVLGKPFHACYSDLLLSHQIQLVALVKENGSVTVAPSASTGVSPKVEAEDYLFFFHRESPPT
jgi:hypothetical protein